MSVKIDTGLKDTEISTLKLAIWNYWFCITTILTSTNSIALMDCELVSQSQKLHKIQSQPPATHYKFSSTNASGCNGSQIVSTALPIFTYNLGLTFTRKTTFTKKVKGREFYQIVPLFQLHPPCQDTAGKKKSILNTGAICIPSRVFMKLN